ncbi:amidophosphoribosyltransferase [Thermogemmatispora sp.]|uniref:amidophosphoribosyltransferase n=1 Tax=Thermogemmatispora sp. TaxID=1968838 RepID=UPI001DCCF110|nr:amidophosphoribosyltransferase [Thermogemmatispora sp.]MBX5450617.1 amidophosphoribosyltransferase [Thermogemmatispora sp.]
MERLRDACGIVGIYARPGDESIDVRQYLTLALTALQHRGQESAGMAVYDQAGRIAHRVGMGKVREVFPDMGQGLPPTRCGIGHVRYSTTGSSCVENAGPFVVGEQSGGREDGARPRAIAVAHNGNLVNGSALRSRLPQHLLSSTTDSEAIALLLLLVEGETLRERMLTAFPLLKGAYSLVMLAEGKLYAVRDPWGMRPLCLGRIGDIWIAASESCALDRIGASFVRNVEPGELITIDEQGLHSEILVQAPRQTLCVFEYIYFSDATSYVNDRYVYLVREALGRELAREHPVEADLVVPVPDSSIPAALGYAAASGIPYGQAIIKNRYSDRTFIKPDQRLRQMEVDLKFNFVRPKVEGQRLVIVDDSIVRGNTMKRLVAALRHQGVREIHLRSSAPPLRHPCYFGIDIPHEDELIAAGRSIEEVAEYIGVDSLGYLSIAGLGRAIASVRRLSDQEAPASGTGEQRRAGIAPDAETREEAVMEGEGPAFYEGLLHREFCYGCMRREGWPFDPVQAADESCPLPLVRQPSHS